MIARFARLPLLVAATCLLASCTFVDPPIAVTLQIIPNEVLDAPAGQPCLLLARIEGLDAGAGSQVTVRASAAGADISPCSWQRSDDGIIEFAVTPDPASTGRKIQVVLVAETDGTVRQDICILHVTDALSDEATISLERTAVGILQDFYGWLIEEWPEIPPEGSGAWTGVPIRPHRLVVSHYLFYSDDWEIVLWWHVTISPHDWARIYVRRRFTDEAPWKAAEIPSLLAGGVRQAKEVPDGVIR